MANSLKRNDVARKLGAVGWGLFFIWIGVAMIYDISPGITLIGIGVITLLVQMVRLSFKLKLEGFWAIVGLAFLLGGVWQQFNMQVSLVPILLVVAGVAVVLTAFWPKSA